MGIFSRSAVGVEIDSREIRIVHMQGKPERAVMCALARFPLKEGVVMDGKAIKTEELGNALSELWVKAGIKCRDIILGINNQEIIVRFATLPKVPLDKLDNLIRLQSMDYIPIQPEEIELDYTITGETKNEAGSFYKVVLVAGRKKMLFQYIKAFQKAHLNISDITSSMLTLNRLIPKKMLGQPLVIVNLSADFGNIVILDRNEIVIARTFGYPHGFRLPESQLLSGSDFTGIPEVPEVLCNFLAEEIRTSVRYYRNQNAEADFQHFAFTGCISTMEGLVPKMKQLMETNVFLLELKELGINQSANSSDIATSDFSICTCLGISGLEV